MIPMLQPGFPALGKHTGPSRFFNLPGPLTFTLLFLKHNRTKRFCMQPCWVCQVYITNKPKPSEEMGEKINLPASITLPCLRYYLLPSQTISLCFWTAGFVKRVPNPAKKGRENELVMNLLPLSRPIGRVWLRAGLRRESKPSEEGERE
jgi:hypothetical protein